MNTLKLLASSSYITLNLALISKIGLEEAIMLGELASEFDYWTKHNGLDDNGYFFTTIENIEKKTALSDHRQRNALKHLQELKLIDYKVSGIPAKRYIRLNEFNIADLLKDSKPKKSTTSNQQNNNFSF